MNKNTSNEIITLLRKIIINPQCELNYNNNFELLCAVMLSAQTTDKRVNMVTPHLFLKYPDPYSLANASISDVKDIIKELGLASNKAKNLIELSKILNSDYDSIVPDSLIELTKLPGVGRKTASVVLSVGFKKPSMPVDTHIYRMAIRLGYVKKNASVLDAELALKKYIPISDWIDAHHLLLLFGRYYCKAINPSCNGCVLIGYCKNKNKNL